MPDRTEIQTLATGDMAARRCSVLAMRIGMFDCLEKEQRSPNDVPHVLISMHYADGGWRSLKLVPAEAMRLGARLIDFGLSMYRPGPPPTSPPTLAPSNELPTCGELLRAACNQKKLNNPQLASAVGVHEITVSRWRNDHDVPSWALRRKLCDVLDLTPDALELAITRTLEKRRLKGSK